MRRFRNSRFFVPTIVTVGLVWVIASYSLPPLKLSGVIDWPLWMVWAPFIILVIAFIAIVLLLGSGVIEIESKDRGSK